MPMFHGATIGRGVVLFTPSILPGADGQLLNVNQDGSMGYSAPGGIDLGADYAWTGRHTWQVPDGLVYRGVVGTTNPLFPIWELAANGANRVTINAAGNIQASAFNGVGLTSGGSVNDSLRANGQYVAQDLAQPDLDADYPWTGQHTWVKGLRGTIDASSDGEATFDWSVQNIVSKANQLLRIRGSQTAATPNIMSVNGDAQLNLGQADESMFVGIKFSDVMVLEQWNKGLHIPSGSDRVDFTLGGKTVIDSKFVMQTALSQASVQGYVLLGSPSHATPAYVLLVKTNEALSGNLPPGYPDWVSIRENGVARFATSVDSPLFNGVALKTDGPATEYLDRTGNYSVPPGGGGGVTTFAALTDTPNSYTGSGGYLLRVNSGQTAVEFVNGDTLYDSAGTASAAVSAHNADAGAHGGVEGSFNAHITGQANSHAQIDGHIATTSGNPHNVTAADAGADPAGTANAAVAAHDGLSSAHGGHFEDTDNPHSTTAVQVGADPAGTAAAAVSAHNADSGAHGGNLIRSSNDTIRDNIVLTQAEYDALSPPDSHTAYDIVG